jgi:hypothetical protein
VKYFNQNPIDVIIFVLKNPPKNGLKNYVFEIDAKLCSSVSERHVLVFNIHCHYKPKQILKNIKFSFYRQNIANI